MVLESQGNTERKQANLEFQSFTSNPTQSSGPPRLQIEAQIASDLRFGNSTYAWKEDEINFPAGLVSYPTKIGVIRNNQNKTDFQNYFGAASPVFTRWAMYRVGV
jgi:hypothetical protein